MLDKLEMFDALARQGHFGRAAESLNIAQPTHSAGIKQLDVQLVHRLARFGGLTPEAESTRVSSKRILGEVRLAVIPTAQTWAARLRTTYTEQVSPSNGPTDWQEEYNAQAEQARRILPAAR